MGRFLDAFDVLTGRAVKARPTPANWATWTAGTGVRFVPPGSQYDYQREVGDLRRNSVVSICVQWLTRQFLQAEWKVGFLDAEGEWQEEPGAQPIADLCERCNPFWPGRQTWAGVLSDYLVYGNAYLMKNRQGNGGGKPVELYWLPAHQVQIKASGDPKARHVIDRYEFDNGTGRENYRPEDIVHFRDQPDPDNPLVGMGKIQAQVRNAAGMQAGERYTAAVLRNPAVGKIISPKVSVENVMRGEVIDEAAMKGTAQGIRKGLAGEGAGGIHAVTLPIELLEANPSPEDMLLDRILDRPEAMILAALGLNAMVLGLPSSRDTKTYANLAEARRDAWQHAVLPIQDDIADALTRQLLPDFDATGTLTVWFDTDEVEALKEDADALANRESALYQATITKRDEARARLGLDPLGPPDGDLFYGEQTEVQMAQAESAMEMQQKYQPEPSFNGEPA